MKYSKKIINGLTIGIIESNSERFNVNISVNAGSLHDLKGKEGLAHLLEHIVLLGSKLNPGKHDFYKKVLSWNGELDAETSQFRTSFSVNGEQQYIKEAVKNLFSVVYQPSFSCLETEKNVVMIENLNEASENNKVIMPDEILLNSYFKEKIHPITGFQKTLRDISEEDLTAFHQHYYVKSNSFILIESNLSEEEISSFLSPLLSELPEGIVSKIDYCKKKVNLALSYQYHQGDGVKEEISFASFQENSEDKYRKFLLLYLLSSILFSSNTNSLIYGRFRDRGLIYNMEDGFLFDDYYQLLIFSFTIPYLASQRSEVFSELFSVFTEISVKGIDEEIFILFKNNLLKTFEESESSYEGILNHLIDEEFFTLKLSMKETRDILKEISKKEIEAEFFFLLKNIKTMLFEGEKDLYNKGRKDNYLKIINEIREVALIKDS